MVHIHARDPENLPEPARRAEIFYEVNKKVRERCPDIIINNTTGGGFNMTMEAKALLPRCQPGDRLAELDSRYEQIQAQGAKAAAPAPASRDRIRRLSPLLLQARERLREGDENAGHQAGDRDISHRRRLGRFKISSSRDWWRSPTGFRRSWEYRLRATPRSTTSCTFFVSSRTGSLWLCSAIGPFQLPLTTLATLLGGHVRVGPRGQRPLPERARKRRATPNSSRGRHVSRTS